MADPTLRNNTALLTASANVVGLSLQINFPWRGDAGNALRPIDLRAITWPGGQRIDLRWTNPADVRRVLIKRSTMGHPVFVTEGETIYNGGPIEHFIDGMGVEETIGASGDVSEEDAFVPRTGVPLSEDQLYYYTVFLTKASGAVGLLDFGPSAPYGSRVTGLSIIDYFAKPMGQFHGNWFYRRFSEATLERDQEDAKLKGRPIGYFEGFCRFVQAGIDLQRGFVRALGKLSDDELLPAGLVGRAIDTSSILAAKAMIHGINPDSHLLDASVLRRLSENMIALSKEKGSCRGLVNFTRMLTLWESTCDEYGDTSCNDLLLRTWDTYSVRTFSYQASTIAIGPGRIVLPGTPFAEGELVGGTIRGAMGDSYAIASNSENVIELVDTEAELRVEDVLDVLSGAPGEGDTEDIIVTRTFGGPPDLRVNEYEGFHLLDGQNQYRRILPTPDIANPNKLRVYALTGVATVLGEAVVAASYIRNTSGDPEIELPLRNARVVLTISQGCLRTLWDPSADQTLGVLYDGGFSTGVPYRPGDRILTISQGVAAAAGSSVEITENTLIDENAPFGAEGSLVNFLLNPNENQQTLFRIVANTSTTLWVESLISGVTLLDVAMYGNRYFVLDPAQARRYDLLVRLANTMSASRVFIHFA